MYRPFPGSVSVAVVIMVSECPGFRGKCQILTSVGSLSKSNTAEPNMPFAQQREHALSQIGVPE